MNMILPQNSSLYDKGEKVIEMVNIVDVWSGAGVGWGAADGAQLRGGVRGAGARRGQRGAAGGAGAAGGRRDAARAARAATLAPSPRAIRYTRHTRDTRSRITWKLCF